MSKTRTHYFTRNRTRGSVFSPFSSLAWEVPTIIAVAFARISGNGEAPALRDRMGTISREEAMFYYPFDCVTVEIISWLQTNPDRSSGDIFREMQRRSPGCYLPLHIRTLRRGMRKIRTCPGRKRCWSSGKL